MGCYPPSVRRAEDSWQMVYSPEVSSDECRIVEFLALRNDEDVVVLRECDKDAEKEGDVASPDAQRSSVRHGAVGDTLSSTGADEEDVSY